FKMPNPLAGGGIVMTARVAVRAFRCARFCVAGSSASQLRVESNPPGAEGPVINPDDTRQAGGQTPITLNREKTPALFKQDVQIQISKDGYLPQSVVLPKISNGASGRVAFNLEQTALPPVCQAKVESFSEIARGVAEVSNL